MPLVRSSVSSVISSSLSSQSSAQSSSSFGRILSPFVHRTSFGYSVPIIPDDVALSFDGPVVFNALTAVLTVVLFLALQLLTSAALAIAPASVFTFLRRLPLTLALFLVVMLLKEFLLPHAYAQDLAPGLPSPALWVVLYGVIFFLLAGLTNVICNNMLTAEAARLEQLFLPKRASAKRSDSETWKRSIIAVLFFFLLFAAIGAHINTHFALLPSVQPGIAVVALVTILATAYSKDGFRFLLAKKFHWSPLLEANVFGILLALLSVWLTRSFGLSPGYLFGVPAGLVILSAQYEKREGPFEVFGLLCMLTVAAVAWLLLPLFNHVEVMHDFQKLLVVILVEGCFFESLPFEYLAGGAVYKWKRWVWAIIFAVTTFLVLQLLWDPSGTLSSIESSPPGMTYVMIVLVYAVSVIALFVYCKVRRKTR